ncbi:MAG: A/G-specific adenine glycosylase [Bdellovibrionales bacterium]|nr:A/G-specific adenine glycosylase [Bdellovibrionales bacterium]
MSDNPHQTSQNQLIKWYRQNKRPLPWRKKKKNPYPIWVSEVMLQQTTVNTVIPYYKKFIKKFKTLESLAKTPLEEVIPYWAGLGYYSRVKNLHKSAQIISKKKSFPRTHQELLKLPGFGPYTARAVSALAFNEKTGVLDANVIRVLTRYLNFKKPWWNKQGREILQKEVDQWMVKYPSSILNQALMELGALVCTVGKPLCTACPLKKNCKALKHNQVHFIPLKKEKKEKEIWFWQPLVLIDRTSQKFTPSKLRLPLEEKKTPLKNPNRMDIKKNKIALTHHHSLPVLKNYPLFPGKAIRKKVPPKRYDFIHSITHHVIYVLVSKKAPSSSLPKVSWVPIKNLQKKNPSSLIKKILSIKLGKF